MAGSQHWGHRQTEGPPIGWVTLGKSLPPSVKPRPGSAPWSLSGQGGTLAASRSLSCPSHLSGVGWDLSRTPQRAYQSNNRRDLSEHLARKYRTSRKGVLMLGRHATHLRNAPRGALLDGGAVLGQTPLLPSRTVVFRWLPSPSGVTPGLWNQRYPVQSPVTGLGESQIRILVLVST